jgi:NodT family efflux transporter outer membrane factor (OMF) lipoprotein
MIRSPARGAWAALALALGACNVMGPDYRRPVLPLTGDFASAVASPDAARATTTASPWADWWTVFGDPGLERLVAQARAGNQDLRAAVARVAAARATARQAGATLLPVVGADGAMTGQKLSGRSSTVSRTTEASLVWSGAADVSYELDLFGRIRRGAEAACADAWAVEEDRRTLEISLIADVALAYFDLGAAEEEARIAREGADLLDKTRGIVQARLDARLVGELDLRRTEGDLAGARALVPEAERKRAVAAHALALLLGVPPGTAFSSQAPGRFDAPPEVPVGLPAGLVERRPDVRAAERRLMAANARIGEAIAAFYPSVTLAGRFGYASTSLQNLVHPAAELWSIGPSIHVPIFEGGRLAAQKFQREAETDAATADYVHAVLRALGEVADAIAGVAARRTARDLWTEAVAAGEKSVELSGTLYEGGLTSYVNVLDGQRALLSARLSLLQAQRDLLTELVRLGKALGGGWR